MDSIELHGQKSIWEHVGELREKLLIALGAFVVGSVVAHIFHEEIIAFLLAPAGGQPLIFLSPLEPIFFIFKIDCIGGLIIAFPIIIWCLFSYINPALSKKTSKLVLIFLAASSFLLIVSLLYAFIVIIPVTLKFLFSITIVGIENNFSVEKYLNFFMIQAFIVMVIFQLPVLIVGGFYLDLLKTKMFTNRRKIIYIVLLVSLAIITPTTDIFSLGIMFVPCVAIFEISLLIGRIIEKLKLKKEKLGSQDSE